MSLSSAEHADAEDAAFCVGGTPLESLAGPPGVTTIPVQRKQNI